MEKPVLRGRLRMNGGGALVGTRRSSHNDTRLDKTRVIKLDRPIDSRSTEFVNHIIERHQDREARRQRALLNSFQSGWGVFPLAALSFFPK